CEEIGVVTDTGRVEFWHKGEVVADVPADPLVLGGGAPVYDREYQEATYYAGLKDYDEDHFAEPEDYVEAARQLIQSPSLVSKRWIYEQYDHTVRINNMGTNKASDAATVRVKGTDKALSMSVDCNSNYVYADPYIGGMIAVSEAARNIVCSGAQPVAITNCLNFGNPYNKEVYWQFVNVIKGMSEACLRFETPVTGGNVSFYNQTELNGQVEPIKPTPVIGMLGILDHHDEFLGSGFQQEGDMIVLMGKEIFDLNCSEYLAWNLGIRDSKAPYFSLEDEYDVQRTVYEANKLRLLKSAHDVSDGGLFTTLLESSMEHDLGARIHYTSPVRMDSFLFGESQSRIVVSIDPKDFEKLQNISRQNSVPIQNIGLVERSALIVNEIDFGPVSQWKKMYDSLLDKKMEQ